MASALEPIEAGNLVGMEKGVAHVFEDQHSGETSISSSSSRSWTLQWRRSANETEDTDSDNGDRTNTVDSAYLICLTIGIGGYSSFPMFPSVSDANVHDLRAGSRSSGQQSCLKAL